LLLLGAAALEGPPHQQHQQLQQQVALCRQYQQQFQQAACSLGLSKGLMAASAACFAEAQQYSDTDSSSSEGVAAGSAAAVVNCLSTVCTAAQMLAAVHTLVDPNKRRSDRSGRVFTAAEELIVADFFLKVCRPQVFILALWIQHTGCMAGARKCSYLMSERSCMYINQLESLPQGCKNASMNCHPPTLSSIVAGLLSAYRLRGCYQPQLLQHCRCSTVLLPCCFRCQWWPISCSYTTTPGPHSAGCCVGSSQQQSSGQCKAHAVCGSSTSSTSGSCSSCRAVRGGLLLPCALILVWGC
jgi:hypothetical protein